MAVSRKPAKKSTKKAPAPSGTEFAVVLEDLRSQFLVFGEALQGLREHVDQRFEQVDAEIKLVKTAVLDLSVGLARVEEKVDKKVDRDEVIPLVQDAVARTAH